MRDGETAGGPRALLQREGRLLWRGVRAPGLWAGLVFALVIWTLAWQVKVAYPIDIGGVEDNAFVRRFHDKEPDPKQQAHPPFKYRWSQGDSEIAWPGMGSVPVTITLRMAAPRPAGAGPVVVTATVRGQQVTIPVTGALSDYHFPVGRGNPGEGDLIVRLQAPTFQLPPDPRVLGVLVDRAEAIPAGASEGPPGVVPPIADLGRWLGSLILLWLLIWRLTGQTRPAATGLVLAAGGVAWGAIAARPNLGLLAPEAPVLLLWAYPLALITRAGAAVLLRRAGAMGRTGTRERTEAQTAGPTGPAETAAGALVAGFLLRTGGMVYPQFISSDIKLHVHNIENVLRGTLLWTGYLPNNAPAPYPPLPYIALAPFAGVVPDLSLVLRAGVGTLDAAAVLPLLYLGARVRSPAAGAWAGWIYALLAAPFVLFSAGVFSNLFGAAVFLWTVALWGSILLAARVARWAWAALGVAFFLTFLSHYGILIAAVAVAGLSTLFALVAGPAVLRRRAIGVAAVVGGAGIAAFLAYYVHYVGVLIPATGSGPAKAADAGVFAPAALADLLGRRLGPDLGAAALLAAGAGWLTAGVAARRIQILTAAAATAALAFAALSLTAGENIRYGLLLAPFVALGGGLFLDQIAARSRAGIFWSIGFLIILAWHLLGIWLPLIFTRYH